MRGSIHTIPASLKLSCPFFLKDILDFEDQLIAIIKTRFYIFTVHSVRYYPTGVEVEISAHGCDYCLQNKRYRLFFAKVEDELYCNDYQQIEIKGV